LLKTHRVIRISLKKVNLSGIQGLFNKRNNRMFIQPNDLVLFQGDSITDAGRDREVDCSLGEGYAMLAAAWFAAEYPETNVKFINRGISGDRTKDLVQRWQADCLDLKPQVLSILIGINDSWRAFDSDHPTLPEEFEKNYRSLLEAAEDLPIDRIVLMEPFLLPNAKYYGSGMRQDLNEKIEVVRRLSREFATALVPLDGLFQQACTRAPAETWSGDGVHLTPAGNALAARAWLTAVVEHQPK
jgi:acyl-CoA thioesterase-1